MTSTKAAWVHPNPLLRGFVVLPDGFQMERHEAEAIGFAVQPWPEGEKLATAHPYDKESVILSRGAVVGRETAREAGFTIGEPITARDPNSPRSWRASISTLPEAHERPAATAELLTSRTPETLTLDQARAFLRGLPVESEPTEETTMTTDTDPRAARLAEISNSMSAFNRNNGHKGAKAAQPSLNEIEPAKLKRLAEIRLSALMANGRGPSQEAKALKLALDTHGSVGTPLARLFGQLGVDMSKMLPST